MKQIPLTQGCFAIVDDADYELLNGYKWYTFKHKNSHNTYARRREGKYKVFMHRQILGLTDPKIYTDHKDKNGLNNQRDNLRIATPAQNVSNKRSVPNSTSKYLGVCYDNGTKKWRASIQKDRKIKYCGCYVSEREAAIAYNTEAVKLHGEFASLNKID